MNEHNRDTCKDCNYYDFCDNYAVNKHPNKASWSHLCIAKNIQKYSSDTACKTYFNRKDK
ncbi:MAG: hypothetical protein IJZ79_01735 [Bacilli bacterium]|nr:hypothetical protein [Bacilli bacterium]